jgi:DnaJ family protein C protein 11
VPPCSLTYSRRLFPDSGTQAVLTLDALSASPSLSVNAVVPRNFDYTPKANSEEDLSDDAPSTSLLSGYALVKGTSFYSIGVSLSGLMSGIRSEFGIMFSRLALDLRVGGTLGVLGLTYWVSGAWNSPDQRTGVDANINSSAEGVALTLKYVSSFCLLSMSPVNLLITWVLWGTHSLRYLGQNLHLPIVLSAEHDPRLALYTSLVPTFALLLGYHLVYQPRQHRKRVA